MKRIEPELAESLKHLCKNEGCYHKVEALVAALMQECNHVSFQLDLLERATMPAYDAIMITDLDLEKPGPTIVYVNNGFTKMTGYAKEEVIGKSPRLLQGPKTDLKVMVHLRDRLLNDQPFCGRTINYKKDGTEFMNKWDIHPLRNEDGIITHWVSYQREVFRDIKNVN